jgi:hypothetical protein
MKRRHFLTGVLAAGGAAPLGVLKAGASAQLTQPARKAGEETGASPAPGGGKNQIRYINPNPPKVKPPRRVLRSAGAGHA